MPSEDRIQRALDALAAPREAFRSAVAGAVAEIGARIEAQRVQPEGRVNRIQLELGNFAGGRIDSTRFASIFGTAETLDPNALARLERAHETLRHLLDRGDALFTVPVPPGADLLPAVGRALSEAGRAFGAARDVEMARTGQAANGGFGEHVGGFAYRRWNRAEREIAPPLVVEVDGGDAQVGGLAELMNGRQKIVLVLRGPAPPAPLARLISPGVFVMQTTDPQDLDLLGSVDGPAIAALVPAACARFVHRPGAAESWQRFERVELPGQEPRSPIGTFTVFQQSEQIGLLRALSDRPAATAGSPPAEAAPLAAAAAAPTAPADPADKLAAWLLSQTDLSGA
jgi:hypothetical protein